MGLIYNTIIVWSIITILLLLSLKKWQKGSKNQPPGPAGWPIIGNILDLGTMPHRSLYDLRLKYGPVVRLRLGSMETVVVQSAKAAEELFKSYDSTFCDRKVPDSFTAHEYNEGSLAIGRYSSYWRMLRRFCSAELMISKRVNETVTIRRNCVHQMIRNIEDTVTEAEAKGESSEVNLPHYMFLMAFNLVGNLMLSRDLLDPKCKQGFEFFEAMDKFMVWAAKPNVADYLPFLKWMDPQRIRRNMVRDMGTSLKIIQGFVDERIEEHKLRGKKYNDFLDKLLDFEGDGKDWNQKIPYQRIIIIILEMFFAGSETTSTTMEWVMTELLRNGEAMKRVKEEIKQIVGDKREVEESDIDKLPYLNAVLKETMRLHAPLPLLLPRNSLQDTNFMGYHIAKDTQILVNAWAIGRDPEVWEDPSSFKPERFLESSIDYKGQNFELIPFGSGRRICVGITLASRVLLLGLASLIHNFDWEVDINSHPELLDVKERMGITARKLEPLRLIPKKVNF